MTKWDVYIGALFKSKGRAMYFFLDEAPCRDFYYWGPSNKIANIAEVY